MEFTIATFNCENLQSRAKVLNFDDNDKASGYLDQVARLDALLAKDVYEPDDQDEILKLLDALSPYLELREMRKKLVTRHKVGGVWKPCIKPSGRGEWLGGVALKEDKLPTGAQKSTAEVIKAVHAEVQCVIEVEDHRTLEQFSDSLLKHTYPYSFCSEGNDARRIEVGLLSKYPLREIKTHAFDPDGAPRNQRIFSRDCLEVEIGLPDGRPLLLLLNHFKSQGYGSPASNDAKRKLQAERVIEILAAHDLGKEAGGRGGRL